MKNRVRINLGQEYRRKQTFTLFEMGLLDKRGNSPGQVIYQANSFDATGNDLVFTIRKLDCFATHRERRAIVPLLGLFDPLAPSSLSIPLALVDRSYMARTDKVICQSNGRFVVVGRDNVGHRMDNALEQLEHQRSGFFMLVQPLQNRPEIGRNSNLISQAASVGDAS
jgi:hypothetical protein